LRESAPNFAGRQLSSLHDSWLRINNYLESNVWEGNKGAALFARSGPEPFYQVLVFQAPVPTWATVGRAPNIYHLVELKDNYHRYVVMLSTDSHARILEVNLGAVTRQLLLARPDLRDRAGREWSREHYLSHVRERSNQFLKEQIASLHKLVAAGGYGHLILAGNPQVTARIRKALPKRLKERLVDSVAVSPRDPIHEVVAATLARFTEEEERGSLSVVGELLRELRSGGPAVSGRAAVLEYLDHGIADVVVVSASLDSELREEIARRAVKTGCHVEVVATSEDLDELGGCGALLRYKLAA
jgi:protein required for attachment to host cells